MTSIKKMAEAGKRCVFPTVLFMSLLVACIPLHAAGVVDLPVYNFAGMETDFRTMNVFLSNGKYLGWMYAPQDKTRWPATVVFGTQLSLGENKVAQVVIDNVAKEFPLRIHRGAENPKCSFEISFDDLQRIIEGEGTLLKIGDSSIPVTDADRALIKDFIQARLKLGPIEKTEEATTQSSPAASQTSLGK